MERDCECGVDGLVACRVDELCRSVPVSQSPSRHSKPLNRSPSASQNCGVSQIGETRGDEFGARMVASGIVLEVGSAKQTSVTPGVGEDVDGVGEDVDGVGEDVAGVGEDVDGVGEDVPGVVS